MDGRPFGRHWVFREIGAWVADVKAPRILLIVGRAGSGKTGIATRLVQLFLDAVIPPDQALDEAIKICQRSLAAGGLWKRNASAGPS